MALVFAGVAFAEYAARDLLLSRGDLLQSNQLHLYFRVNSLFYDPNLFGRDLALTSGRPRRVSGLGARHPAPDRRGDRRGHPAWRRSRSATRSPASGRCSRACWWSRRCAGAFDGRLRAGRAILVCGAIFLLVSGTGQTDVGSAESSSTTTSGRVDLVRGGIDAGGGPSHLGLGLGLVRRRVLPPHRAREDDRLPHRAGHGRGRAGGDRARRLPGSRRPRLDRPVQRRRAAPRRARRRPPASWPWSSTASATRRSRSTRRPGRCSAWASRCGEAGRRPPAAPPVPSATRGARAPRAILDQPPSRWRHSR